MHGRRVLGIIPARGGSKRLPRKNVLDFAGKPMIAWTIEAALAATGIERVILSSDDAEIMEVAARFGCDVPFRRPPELASDQASSSDLVHHALGALGEPYDMIVLLQPTSPLRTAADIDGTLALAIAGPGQSAVSVAPLPKPKTYFGDMRGGTFVSTDFFGAAQPCTLNGAVYAISTERFRQLDGFMDEETQAYLMPLDRSIDIDDLQEFRMAEALMRLRSPG